MRNKYAGPCYRCGETVEPGDGHFERYKGGWRTQHATCAIKFRAEKVNKKEAQAEKSSLRKLEATP